jgi:hypothetical protein
MEEAEFPRKAVALGTGPQDTVIVLADDGTVWQYQYWQDAWWQLPPLPEKEERHG